MNGSFGSAAESIKGNRLRSFLTMAIIAVGIMSLTGIQTAIEVFSGELSGSFSQFGASTLTITGKEDFTAISLDEALLFCEMTDSASISRTLLPAASVSAEGETTDPVAQVIASDADYLRCNGLHLSDGRNFSPAEAVDGAAVCLAGGGIAAKLFGSGAAAVGQNVSFGAGDYRIVGVMARRGISFGGNSDCSIIVPVKSAGGIRSDGDIVITIRTDGTEETKAILHNRMRRIRRRAPTEADGFELRSADSAASTLASLKAKLSAAALAVGLITMLGAAVGLMNIMLVSVNERRREIGLRKAVGACRQEILMQFLAEAALMGMFGATAGIMLGIAAGNCVALALECSFRIPWPWILASLALTAAVSLLSGLLPARKAAALEPVEALKE